MKNCIFIGIEAGIDITEGDGIIIIGDNVKSLYKAQSNVLFIGDKMAIGNTIKGIPINLSDVINKCYKKH